MQLNTMDCNTRTNNVERDSDLGDDMSHEDHSDDDIRDCDSLDGDHHVTHASRRINKSRNLNDINFPGGGTRSPLQHPDLQMNHHHQFPPNHPLNALGNFMGIGGLHGIPNLQQHNDVLEKLKMQVRDMKMDQDYAAAAHAAAFGPNMLPSQLGTAFSLPPTSAAPFGHPAQSISVHQNAGGNPANGALTNGSSANNSFSFTSPTAPGNKEVNPASNSSTSSEASNSSQQNNGWSFEEQYKQVRQLYEINDDPKRKEFLDDLFSFMQKRGTPINRLPIMAKSVLDLYELYNLVIARGGLVDVINKKLWQEIIKGLHLPSSITSAAFTLRTQYMKYLYPYECEKKNLSTPAELQAAIDGNRREGRRSSYGQYEAMHNQMQMPQLARQTLAGSMQQMSPLALVTHAAAANNQQAQAAAAAAAAAHHRLMTPPFGQVPNLVKHEIEQRMMEYLKLIQAKEEHNASLSSLNGGSNGVGNQNLPGNLGVGTTNPLANSPLAQAQAQLQQQQQQQQQQHQQAQQQQSQHQQQQQPQRRRSQSPELNSREAALNALEMSRVAFWQMYNNTTSPPASINVSPQGNSTGNNNNQQRSEALNLSDSPPNLASIKRERDREPTPEPERDDFQHQPPPAKRSIANSLMPPGFPNFYLPHNLAAAANFHHHAAGGVNPHDSDNEHDDEHDEDEDEHHPHNTTTNSSNHEENETINGRLHHHLHSHHLNHHHENHLQNERQHQDNKSDDSAIENSPTTSSAGGNGHISPISTKKILLSKQHLQHHHHQQQQHNPQQHTQQTQKEKKLNGGSSNGSSKGSIRDHKSSMGELGPLETLNLLSGMQFKVARNGLGPNGEQQLLVNLELNGIKYSGLLLANVNDSDLLSLNNNNNNGKLSPRKCVNSSSKQKNSNNSCLTLDENSSKTSVENFERNHLVDHEPENEEDDEEMQENHDDENHIEDGEEEQQNLRSSSCPSDQEDEMENLSRKPTTTITATTLLTKDSNLTPLTPAKNKLNNNQVTSPSSSSSSSNSSNSSTTSTTTTSSASTAIQQLTNGPSPVANAAVVAAATASALQNLKDALITS